MTTYVVMPVKTGIQAAALVTKQALLAPKRYSLDTDFRRYNGGEVDIAFPGFDPGTVVESGTLGNANWKRQHRLKSKKLRKLQP